MPLTKKDLTNLKSIIDASLEEKLTSVNKDFNKKLNKVDLNLNSKIELTLKDLKKIKKDLKTMLDFLDRQDVDLGKRVSSIEERLGIPPLH